MSDNIPQDWEKILRDAILEDDEYVSHVSFRSGVPSSTIHDIINDRVYRRNGMSIRIAAKLADYLGFELVRVRPSRK